LIQTVDDLLSPIIALFSGSGAALVNRMRVLRSGKSGAKSYETLELAKADGAVVLSHGKWLQTILNFFSIAPVLFLIVKVFTASQKAIQMRADADEKAAPPTHKACPGCLEDVKSGLSETG
jgi:large conductance mechanosensitive channel